MPRRPWVPSAEARSGARRRLRVPEVEPPVSGAVPWRGLRCVRAAKGRRSGSAGAAVLRHRERGRVLARLLQGPSVHGRVRRARAPGSRGHLPSAARLALAVRLPAMGRRPLRRVERTGGPPQGGAASQRTCRAHQRPAHPALPDGRRPKPLCPRGPGWRRVAAVRVRHRGRRLGTAGGRRAEPPLPRARQRGGRARARGWAAPPGAAPAAPAAA
mmetsp:Transcript_80139/g.238673  ORF Transcript_80139/g.238673 Transcript_80139/m.238673 type:complete len:215 (-) Transcript_80139:759-1403(-)